MIPVRSNIYQVNVAALTHLFIAIGTTIDNCRRKARLAQKTLAPLRTLLFVVTKSNNLNTGNVTKTIYSSRTTISKPDKGNMHVLYLRCLQTKS